MRKTLLCTAALIGSFTTASFGQTWDGDTSADFADGNNWVGGTAPNGTAGFTINNVSDATPFAPVLTTSYLLDPNGGSGDGYIGRNSGGNGTLDINSGGTLDGSGNWLFIGNGGATGTLTVNNGGTLTSDNDVRLDNGSLIVNAGGIVTVDDVVGGAGSSISVSDTGRLTTVSNAALNQVTATNLSTGGLINGGGGNIIFANTPSTINGGTVNAGNELWVGNGAGSNSSLTIDSGTVTSGAWLAVGRNGSIGELNVNGGTITQSTQFIAIGSDLGAGAGDGTVNQTAGTVTVPAARVGENGSAVGTYNISGGTFDAGAGALELGFNNTSTGTLNISSSATVTSTGTTFVGKWDSSVGLLTVEGSAATVSLGNLWVGLDATGADSSAVGTIAFVADSGGVSTITISGDINLLSPDGDLLTVDFSALENTGSGLIDVLLIDGATSQGEFTGLAQGATVPGALGGTIDYSEAGNIWIRNVTIPEPSIAILGGLGVLGLLRRRRQS